jgi:hypothetical protein
MAIDLTPLFKARGLYEQMDWNQLNQLAQGFGLGYSREAATNALTEARRREAQAIRDREKEIYRSNVAGLENVLPGTQIPVSTLGSAIGGAFAPNAPERPFVGAEIVPPALGLDIPNYAPDLTLDPFGNAVASQPFGDGVGDSGVGAAQEYINRPLELGAPTSDTYTLANSLMSQHGYTPAWQEEQKTAFEQEAATGELLANQDKNEIARQKAEADMIAAQAKASQLTPTAKARTEWQKLEPKTRQAAAASAKILAMKDTNTDEYNTAITDLYGNVMLRDDSGAVLAPSDQINIMMGSMDGKNRDEYLKDYEAMLNKIYGTANVVEAAKNLPGQIGLGIGSTLTVGALIAGGGGGALINALTEGKPEKLNAGLMKLNQRYLSKGKLDPTKVKEVITARYGIDIENGVNSGFLKNDGAEVEAEAAPLQTGLEELPEAKSYPGYKVFRLPGVEGAWLFNPEDNTYNLVPPEDL